MAEYAALVDEIIDSMALQDEEKLQVITDLIQQIEEMNAEKGRKVPQTLPERKDLLID